MALLRVCRLMSIAAVLLAAEAVAAAVPASACACGPAHRPANGSRGLSARNNMPVLVGVIAPKIDAAG